MQPLRRLAIPALTGLLVVTPVVWAFPEELPLWRSLGIVLGWIGMGSLLASLTLMLREPKLAEAIGGLERMYRWHHGVGLGAYLALLLHPLALAVEAWSESPALAWQTLSPATEGWPVWLGWFYAAAAGSALRWLLGVPACFSGSPTCRCRCTCSR